MRSQRHKHNSTGSNQSGSTLVMVIISIAFIGMLGFLILSISMINLRMKQVANTSKDNFYTCEKALEEIRTGLEEMSAVSIQATYEEVLESYVLYSALDDTTRNQQIQDLVLARLNLAVGSNMTDIAALFQSFLSNSSDYTITIGGKTIINIPVPYTNSIIFSNVTVAYIKNDYKTSVTSDMKITLPSFVFSSTEDTINYSMKQPYEGYAIVADGSIISDNISGSNTITGNLYSGAGIRVKDTDLKQNHSLTLKGDYIVTRGDIVAEDTGTLIIRKMNIEEITIPLICADNIKTSTSGSYTATSSLPTTLDINGICMVKDDLNLEGRNSNAVFDGAYIGYSNAHTVEGSAIVINGSGTSLDLSQLSSLVLVGRANVSVEDSILQSIGANPDINIMTGESLAIKNNQRAYLVPGQYIFLKNGATTTVAMHNPLTEKDLLSGVPYINITSTTQEGEVNCIDYTMAHPNESKIAVKQLASSTGSFLRYYYLNFKSGIKADQYLTDYISKYPSNLQTFSAFTVKKITLPVASRILSAGNVMYYDSVTYPDAPIQCLSGLSTDDTDDITYADDEALDSYLADKSFNDINYDLIYSGSALMGKKVSDLSNIYFNLTHYLTPTPGKRNYMKEDPVVGTSVLRNGIAQSNIAIGDYTSKLPGFQCYASLATNTWSGTDENAKSIVILNGDAVIAPNSRFNGLLITTGNITIGEGARINGIVIAAGNGTTSSGDIEVQDNANIIGRLIAKGDVILKQISGISSMAHTDFNTALSVNQFLEEIFREDGDILWKLFVNPDPTVNISEGGNASDLVNLNNLVTIENWRMNE